MRRTIVIVYAFLLCTYLFAQENENPVQSGEPQRVLLAEISGNIDQYRGRELKLILRLQYVYTDSAVVSFYDEENINIQFDISGYKENTEYKKSLVHSYRGREYVVTCTIQDSDAEGDLIASLVRFEPYSLYQLPY